MPAESSSRPSGSRLLEALPGSGQALARGSATRRPPSSRGRIVRAPCGPVLMPTSIPTSFLLLQPHGGRRHRAADVLSAGRIQENRIPGAPTGRQRSKVGERIAAEKYAVEIGG